MDPIVPPDQATTGGGRLPLAPDGGAPVEGRARRWPWVVSGGFGLLVLAIVGSLFIPTPYYRLSPGSVRTTESLISIEGAPTFPDDVGDIGYTTISLGDATVFELVTGWLDPDVEILTEDEAYPDTTPSESRERNLAAMASSKDVATVVALEAVGLDVAYEGTGAQIVEAVEGAPAADAGLERGDTIVAVDGDAVSTAEDVGAALEGLAPGDEVAVTYEPWVDHGDGGPAPAAAEPAEARTVALTLGAREDDPSAPFLGVATQTRDLSFDLPVVVTIDTGDVGGPSAGLAFTLGMVDLLTPGDLTGGRKVATTGTIRLDGSVGEIGGIEQKAAAVRDAGVEVFLVPLAEQEAAAAAAGSGVEVVGVATLDDALVALADRGGDVPPVEQQAAGAG